MEGIFRLPLRGLLFLGALFRVALFQGRGRGGGGAIFSFYSSFVAD